MNVSTSELVSALPTNSVRESLRIQLAQILQGPDPDRISLGLAVQAIVDRLLYLHMRADVFSRTEPGDWSVTVGEGIAPEISFQALTPRGAVFLGELASVGFFGADTQASLS